MTWFSTPIWHTKLTCDFDKIKQGCLRLRRETEGRQYTNIGGWQSQDLVLRDVTEFQDLDIELVGHIQSVCQQVDANFKLKLTNSWVNINKPNDYNNKHCHPMATLSGCVYVAANENSGEIRFNTPAPQHLFPIRSTSNIFLQYIEYPPVTGLLLLFPSWVEHEVLPSPKSDEDRISISFNLIQV